MFVRRTAVYKRPERDNDAVTFAYDWKPCNCANKYTNVYCVRLLIVIWRYSALLASLCLSTLTWVTLRDLAPETRLVN